MTSKNKLIDIINKLECLVLKELECISEFLIEALFIFNLFKVRKIQTIWNRRENLQ